MLMIPVEHPKGYEESLTNMPADIRVAVPHYKPIRNETDEEPDYFLHDDEWLVYLTLSKD